MISWNSCRYRTVTLKPTSLLVWALLLAGSASAAEGDLFQPPQSSIIRISPGGDYFAVVVRSDGAQQVDSLQIADQQRTTVFTTADLAVDEATITDIGWVDDNTLAIFVSELTEGVAKLSDTRNVKRLFVVDIDDPDRRLRFVRTGGTMISARPEVENEILFGISGSTSFVYRIDTSRLGEWGKALGKTALPDGGQFSRKRRMAEVDGYVVGWISDVGGRVRGALRFKPDDGVALLLRDNDFAAWEEERVWKPKKKRWGRSREPEIEDDIYKPVAIIEGSNDFIIIADDESGRDGVYRYNYASDTRTLVYQHATAEIVDVDLNHDGSEILSVTFFEEGVIKQQFLDGQYQQVAAALRARYPGYNANIASVDRAGNRFAVYLSSSAQPGRVLVSNREADVVQELFEVAPWLNEEELARSVAGRVESTGFDIEYYLTLPSASEATPLVVYPHGGPWGTRDYRMYDPTVQYLAQRGFAVLQVNFRGSGGYGQEFLESGDGEFGTGMLEDLEAAIGAVAARQSIDTTRICVVGHSYGGYAALMLAARTPDRFRCVASFAGPTDIGLLLGTFEVDEANALLTKITGQTTPLVEQYGMLKSISPLYLAERLTVPVLLAHGDNDRRVDIEHGYRMKMRLEQLDKRIQWQKYEDQGHGLDSPELNFEYSKMLADFVAEHTAQ